MSYTEVAGLVERQCGARVLSAQAIWQVVQDQALQISDRIERSTLKGLSNPAVKVASTIDWYDSSQAEIVLLDDAIGVKAQKPQRQRPPNPDLETLTHPQTVTTDVVMLQTAPQQFEVVSAPIDGDGSLRLPIETVVQARVQQIYAGSPQPLPLVVISDGAQVIRNRWRGTFGRGVFLLDWYHCDWRASKTQGQKLATARQSGFRLAQSSATQQQMAPILVSRPSHCLINRKFRGGKIMPEMHP